jgi:hypothetical protein
MIHFLLHILGLDNASGPLYLFWSGFFGDMTIFGAVIFYYRHNNCHVKNCPRIGKHSIDGTPFKVCKRHHPDIPKGDISYLHIVKAHKQAYPKRYKGK